MRLSKSRKKEDKSGMPYSKLKKVNIENKNHPSKGGHMKLGTTQQQWKLLE